MEVNRCKACGEELIGRIDKIYCNPYCKSSFHYEKNKASEASDFKKIDNQLKLNRRLLKEYNKAGKATVRSAVLLKRGFNPDYFTHYYKTAGGSVYLFCYEYGFLKKSENNKNKYVLVQWQQHMAKKTTP